jgi:hypothetical protein
MQHITVARIIVSLLRARGSRAELCSLMEALRERGHEDDPGDASVPPASRCAMVVMARDTPVLVCTLRCATVLALHEACKAHNARFFWYPNARAYAAEALIKPLGMRLVCRDTLCNSQQVARMAVEEAASTGAPVYHAGLFIALPGVAPGIDTDRRLTMQLELCPDRRTVRVVPCYALIKHAPPP